MRHYVPQPIPLDGYASLAEAYQYWWQPRQRPSVYYPWQRVAPPPRPHCGMWYRLPAEIPATATWALVHLAFRPGRILFAKSREAADAFLANLALVDHPHVRRIPVDPHQPAALARWLHEHGLAAEDSTS